MPRPTYLGTAHSLALRAWRTKFPAGQLQPHDELVCVIQAGIEEIEAPLRAEIERLRERIDGLREGLVVADARMTKQLSGKLMSVTLIAYLNQIQQDMRVTLKADAALAPSAPVPRESAEPAEERTCATCGWQVASDFLPLCKRKENPFGYECCHGGHPGWTPKPAEERGPEVGE